MDRNFPSRIQQVSPKQYCSPSNPKLPSAIQVIRDENDRAQQNSNQWHAQFQKPLSNSCFDEDVSMKYAFYVFGIIVCVLLSTIFMSIILIHFKFIQLNENSSYLFNYQSNKCSLQSLTLPQIGYFDLPFTLMWILSKRIENFKKFCCPFLFIILVFSTWLFNMDSNLLRPISSTIDWLCLLYVILCITFFDDTVHNSNSDS